jgi:translation elongation factor EF-4
MLTYEMPLSEITVLTFWIENPSPDTDASMDYESRNSECLDVVKVDILINGESRVLRNTSPTEASPLTRQSCRAKMREIISSAVRRRHPGSHWFQR